jgi:hypothetical protein
MLGDGIPDGITGTGSPSLGSRMISRRNSGLLILNPCCSASCAQSCLNSSGPVMVGGAAVVGMLLIGGTFYWGYDVGNTNRYAHSLNVKSVSAWAASSEGQAAYKLDQDGDLRSLIRCDRDGWSVQRSQDGKHKLCIVRPASSGLVSGWYVPYGGILARGKRPAVRLALAEEYSHRVRISDERVDAAEVASFVRAAAAARNGWKVILARCAPTRRRPVANLGAEKERHGS